MHGEECIYRSCKTKILSNGTKTEYIVDGWAVVEKDEKKPL